LGGAGKRGRNSGFVPIIGIREEGPNNGVEIMATTIQRSNMIFIQKIKFPPKQWNLLEAEYHSFARIVRVLDENLLDC